MIIIMFGAPGVGKGTQAAIAAVRKIFFIYQPAKPLEMLFLPEQKWGILLRIM